jgi:glycosyltransferase involved in cell wall biosynthesis
VRIVQVVPGSGGTFYCPNCVRDGNMVRGLRALGHDVTVVPLYLPPETSDPDLATDSPVFYGAVRLYLAEKLPVFRRLPGWAERLLDSPGVLAWAARRAGSTAAAGLEEMTLSVLAGESGRQAAELEKLVSWLREGEKPDVVHISTALLLGLAGRIREALGVPVVCGLQDEDVWVDAMGAEGSRRVWEAMSVRAADVDAFVAVSRHYADAMASRLSLPPGKVRAVHVGVPLEGCDPAEVQTPPVVGYLSRMSESLGLGLLVEAYLRLRKEPGLAGLRLRATGGQVGPDAAFVRGLRAKLEAAGASADAEFLPAFDRESRVRFLRSLSVLSVPVPTGEAFGIHAVESLAVGVPVVLPRAGAFPEIVEATGGGLLCEPGDVDSLTGALRELLLDPARARELGARGRAEVHRRFSAESAAREMSALYESVAGPGGRAEEGS